jgi:hypothetical protein
MRRARTCYDHVAGRLGVTLLDALIANGAVVRTDGGTGTALRPADGLAAAVQSHPYRLGPAAEAVFARLGVDLAGLHERPASARPRLRFCVDWSEQRHHLAGALGAAVLHGVVSAGWITRRGDGRAVEVTALGFRAFADALGLQDFA